MLDGSTIHHVLFNMGDLHLVLPALNLSTLNAGILIIMQQVRLMMFSLNMHGGLLYVLPLVVHLRFFRGDHSEPFLLFEVYCWTPPSCLKVMGWWCWWWCWWWWWGGWPMRFLCQPKAPWFWVFGFLALGFGMGLDN